MAYITLILHRGEEDWAQSVRDTLREHTGRLFGDPGLVECVDELPAGDADRVVALYLATPEGREDDALQDAVRAATESGVVVVPVVRPDDAFDDVVPEILSPVNAIAWSANGHDTMLHVLAALGLTDSERAVFISYRRTDAAPIAEALWQRLSQRRFDVFLDRFSVDPGDDFHARIRSELCDKAFVVIIESPDAGGSRWVEYEVSYAQTHHIGMRAITLPATTAKQRFDVIPEPFRIPLGDDDVLQRADGSWELAPDALEPLIRQLERAHQDVLVRRHAELDGDVRKALHAAGHDVTLLSDRFLLAMTTTTCELLRVTARAPRPHDLWRLDSERERLADGGRLDRATCSARLIHASADVEADALRLADWIGGGHRLETTLLANLYDALEPAP